MLERRGDSVASRALWNLRWLGLFLLGPVVGVALVGSIFGLPGPLKLAAGGTFLLSLGLFATLFRGERRRLRGGRHS